LIAISTRTSNATSREKKASGKNMAQPFSTSKKKKKRWRSSSPVEEEENAGEKKKKRKGLERKLSLNPLVFLNSRCATEKGKTRMRRINRKRKKKKGTRSTSVARLLSVGLRAEPSSILEWKGERKN